MRVRDWRVELAYDSQPFWLFLSFVFFPFFPSINTNGMSSAFLGAPFALMSRRVQPLLQTAHRQQNAVQQCLRWRGAAWNVHVDRNDLIHATQ